MTYRQTETSREIRLWVTQVIIPIVSIAVMIPESREAIVNKARDVKDKIKNKFHK